MFKKTNWKKVCKKAKTGRQKLKKQLDAFWSLVVKQRDGNKCVVVNCGKTTHLNSHHIFGKRNMATRFDLENGICLCSGHHTLNTFSAHQSPAFEDWIKEYIGGERYNRIKVKSFTIKKWTMPEMKELVEIFKKEITSE